MTLLFQKIHGMTQRSAIRANNDALKKANYKGRGLFELAKCGDKYASFIREYSRSNVKMERPPAFLTDPDNPIVICVVKDDLMRMHLFLQYYRKLGIKQFAIMDDCSSDGTKEFLMAQKDVAMFTEQLGYTTLRRQVWIQKMIEMIGLYRWYLIVDSDELFDFKDSDKISLREFAISLKLKGRTRSKAILLDMFSEDALYSARIREPEDITRVCNLFYPKYQLDKNQYDTMVRGGAREILIAGIQVSPWVSKYPLVFVDELDVMLNSHYCFPFTRNRPAAPASVLRHYKFLPGDRKKYNERITKGNFLNNSQDYKAYAELEKHIDYRSFSAKLIEYIDFNSTASIPVMRSGR